MSRLRELLRVATPSTRNTQQETVQACIGVAQQAHIAQQKNSKGSEQINMDDFEELLSIVGPAYRTPAHEYALLRELARNDLPAAFTCYRIMAAQIERSTSYQLLRTVRTWDFNRETN